MRRACMHRSIGGIPLAWSMLLLPRLPILSRCYLARRGTPLVLPFPPPLGPRHLFPRAERATGLAREGYVSVREALLTYRLPPISYTRNIADHNGRARAKLHLHTGRIVPFRRVKDLARPWRCPAPRPRRSFEKRFVITRGAVARNSWSRLITDKVASAAVILVGVN